MGGAGDLFAEEENVSKALEREARAAAKAEAKAAAAASRSRGPRQRQLPDSWTVRAPLERRILAGFDEESSAAAAAGHLIPLVKVEWYSSPKV